MGASRVKLAAGRQVGDWQLVEGGKLGRDVWTAESTAGLQGVLKTARAGTTWQQSRFEHEVQVMQALQFLPGVLRVLDADSASPPTWMVTERATTFSDHFRSSPDLRSVVEAFAQVAVTLADAAKQEVAHRDIKPANLFYTRGRALVGDFGLATGHGQDGLTMDGNKVGPANFAAPEALEWSADTDPHAADVFSFAKSLWAVAAGRRYPPQGPLVVQLAEVDLTEIAGRASQDLARLLEIATATVPDLRPNMTTMRDELNHWLDIHPPGTTERPTARRYRNAFDEFYSARALASRGLDAVLDRSVHQVLDACRDLRAASSSSLTKDPSAWLDPKVPVGGGGDPDWTPDHLVTLKLTWTGVADVRLVATGFLEGSDDFTLEVAWQVRDPDTLTWSVGWSESGRERLRLPSELVARRQLQRKIRDSAPARLGEGVVVPQGPAAEALRRMVEGAAQRESERNAAREQGAARERAAEQALTLFDEYWSELTEYVRAIASEGRPSRGQGAWLLSVEDRRLVVQIHEPASTQCPAVQLGSVTVESDSDSGSLVANLGAWLAPDGAPVWRLLRLQRNDLAPRKVPVSESLTDGLGGVGHHELEVHFQEVADGVHATSVSLRSSEPLDVENLTVLFASEADALDRL